MLHQVLLSCTDLCTVTVIERYVVFRVLKFWNFISSVPKSSFSGISKLRVEKTHFLSLKTDSSEELDFRILYYIIQYVIIVCHIDCWFFMIYSIFFKILRVSPCWPHKIGKIFTSEILSTGVKCANNKTFDISVKWCKMQKERKRWNETYSVLGAFISRIFRRKCLKFHEFHIP